MASKQKESQKANPGRIAAFVGKYSNKSSGSGYKSAIESFIRCTFNLPKRDDNNHRIQYDYEEKFNEYITECKMKRDAITQTHNHDKKTELIDEYETMLKNDFSKFARCLGTECKSKQSARQIMTYARLVLSDNGIKVPEDTTRDLKRELKGGRANTLPDLTGDMICRIVKSADVRGRAVVLMLSSSGLRINELLAIKFKDQTNIATESYIDLDHKPVKLYVAAKDAKNKKARFSFISTEATKALKEWLKVRNEYVKTAASHAENLQGVADKKNTGKKYKITNASDPHLLPYSDNTITSAWETSLLRAGVIQKDDYNPFNIHTLRAFFLSASKYAGYSALGEYLAGHSGYLDDSYKMAPESAIRDYKKLEPVIRCCIENDVKEELSMQKKELSQLREGTAITKDAYEGMKLKNERLERDIQKQQEQFEAIQKRMDNFEQIWSIFRENPEVLRELVNKQKK